jgi:hypothetical protein
MQILYGNKKQKFPDMIQIKTGLIWTIQRPFVISNNGIQILIPLGFETDGASIPLIGQNLIRSIDECVAVYIKHDLGYGSHIGARSDWDDMLLDDLEDLKTSWIYRNTIYSGVRIGGWQAWNSKTDYGIKKIKLLVDRTKEMLSIRGNQYGIWLNLNTGRYYNEWQVS